MEHIGHIESADATRPLTRDAWIAVVVASDDLHSIPPREGINPFTGEPTLFRVPGDSVHLVRDGAHIGSFSWAPPDYPFVNAAAEPEYLAAVVSRTQDFAMALGGRFVSAED